MTSDGEAPGERDVTTSHQTAQTSDNGLAETELLVNDLVVESFLLFTQVFEQHLCVSLSSFSSKIDIRDGISGHYQGDISGNGQTNEGISGHHQGQGDSKMENLLQKIMTHI